MTTQPPNKHQNPDDAIADLATKLGLVSIDPQPTDGVGRVLAEGVSADRDSPAADVSAMDGYGVMLGDLQLDQTIAISGESAPGSPPPTMEPGEVVRVFTGAIVPQGCEAVVKREDTEELEGSIRFRESAKSAQLGEHIRRAGENAKAGSNVLSAGTRITAAHRATMANFGCTAAAAYSSVRVCIITTGDEVGQFADELPQPWQLRNSNRASLTALLEPLSWVTVEHVDHCRDDRESLSGLLNQRLSQCDAILLTGGVSMGDYDYVPDVVRDAGGEIVFHGLPIRPGKPILGAATANGKLIMGLPGNPVSATIGCRRMAMPLLAKLSGQTNWLAPCPVVGLEKAGDKTIPLHWLRLVKLTAHGIAEPVMSQGSGDLVSLGQSDGFVELPPSASGAGPWPFHAW